MSKLMDEFPAYNFCLIDMLAIITFFLTLEVILYTYVLILVKTMFIF